MKSLLLATALLAPAVFASTAGASVSPPAPTGAAPVGFTRTTLTDHYRIEAIAAETGPRRVPLRVWYPASAPGAAPAVTLTTAEQTQQEVTVGLPSGAFDGLGSAATAGAPPARGSHPVLLMSPGGREITAFMSAHAADLASHGYVVVGIDVPGEADSIDLGDGTLAPLAPALQESSYERIALRSRDMRFVVSRLGSLQGVGKLDLHRIGAFGHSNGGATAADAMMIDRRIGAGVDIDGSIFGPVVKRGLDRPFGVIQGNEIPAGYASVREFRSHLRGPRPFVHMPGTRHHSFTDAVWLVPQFGVDPEEFEVGTVEPLSSVREQNTLLRRFFDAYSRG